MCQYYSADDLIIFYARFWQQWFTWICRGYCEESRELTLQSTWVEFWCFAYLWWRRLKVIIAASTWWLIMRFLGNSSITSTRDVSGLNCNTRGWSDLNRIHPDYTWYKCFVWPCKGYESHYCSTTAPPQLRWNNWLKRYTCYILGDISQSGKLVQIFQRVWLHPKMQLKGPA